MTDQTLTDSVLDRLFLEARTHNAWQDRPVSEDVLRQLYSLTSMGPTSFNGSPMRLVFVCSDEGKARLCDTLLPSNVAKTMQAPVCAIVAHDMSFWEAFPILSPHKDVRGYFRDNAALTEETAFRNSSMQGAYLIMAARALGLDCGPMSGFDRSRVDELFFGGTSWRSNFLCNLGYGDPSALYPRNPRLAYETACRLA
ncbi:MAG: malonic semialdehyde reductase [Azoarcus sp.]|nr:MAG: malonic semialdehyde reductase [Azoarcus sp.]